MQIRITPHVFIICLLSTATILSSSSSSSKRSPAPTRSAAKRQRLTVYSYSPSTMPASAIAARTTVSPVAHTEIQPSLDASGVINSFGDAITSLRIAAAKVVMQPQGLQIEPRLSGQKYLDAFTHLPLPEPLAASFNLHLLYAHWQMSIQIIANCPDLSLACKHADNFIALLARNRVDGSFDFAARTLLAKAHRLAHAGLHALEQKDHAQAKEHLHHATILYYKLQPINLTTKVTYTHSSSAIGSCIAIPDVTADFMRLQICLQTLGTLKVDVPTLPITC